MEQVKNTSINDLVIYTDEVHLFAQNSVFFFNLSISLCNQQEYKKEGGGVMAPCVASLSLGEQSPDITAVHLEGT